jgi:prophage antirepressor-like protein
LLELMSDMRHQTRALVWRPLEGRHYVFHGTPMQVIEDDAHVRWVRAADVRRIVGFTASDRALALTYPNGWQLMGQPPEPHISDEALITHLRKESSTEAGRFKHWVERTIAYPARQLRARRSD